MSDHEALEDVPVLTYKLRPALSRSLKNEPFLKPLYPIGSVFPSASRIKPSLSSLSTSLSMYRSRDAKKAASVTVLLAAAIAETRSISCCVA
jgi:hypothetical protein